MKADGAVDLQGQQQHQHGEPLAVASDTTCSTQTSAKAVANHYHKSCAGCSWQRIGVPQSLDVTCLLLCRCVQQVEPRETSASGPSSSRTCDVPSARICTGAANVAACVSSRTRRHVAGPVQQCRPACTTPAAEAATCRMACFDMYATSSSICVHCKAFSGVLTASAISYNKLQ